MRLPSCCLVLLLATGCATTSALENQVQRVQLQHVPADELQPILSELLEDRRRSDWIEVAVEGSKTLRISGRPELVAEAVSLVRRLDQPAPEERIFRLSNPMPKELQETIKRFLEEERQREMQPASASNTGGKHRRMRPLVRMIETDSGLQIEGTPEAREQVRRLVKELQKQR